MVISFVVFTGVESLCVSECNVRALDQRKKGLCPPGTAVPWVAECQLWSAPAEGASGGVLQSAHICAIPEILTRLSVSSKVLQLHMW